jgi:hypothetical protein
VSQSEQLIVLGTVPSGRREVNHVLAEKAGPFVEEFTREGVNFRIEGLDVVMRGTDVHLMLAIRACLWAMVWEIRDYLILRDMAVSGPIQ